MNYVFSIYFKATYNISLIILSNICSIFWAVNLYMPMPKDTNYATFLYAHTQQYCMYSQLTITIHVLVIVINVIINNKCL